MSQLRDSLFIHRLLVIVFLDALVLIHVLDLPSKVEETPYLALGYLVLIAVALFLMQQLMFRESPVIFVLTVLLGCAVACAFIVTRTLGLPDATGDIGNWTEPLGLASLVVDVMLIVQAGLGWFTSIQPIEKMPSRYEGSVKESLR